MDAAREKASLEHRTIYESKAPCKWGHKPYRYTKSAACVECNRARAAKFNLKEALIVKKNLIAKANDLNVITVYYFSPEDKKKIEEYAASLLFDHGIVVA